MLWPGQEEAGGGGAEGRREGRPGLRPSEQEGSEHPQPLRGRGGRLEGQLLTHSLDARRHRRAEYLSTHENMPETPTAEWLTVLVINSFVNVQSSLNCSE